MGQAQIGVHEVGAVAPQTFEELAHRRLDTLGPAVPLCQVSDAIERSSEAMSVRQLQSATDQPVDLFADRAAAQRVAHTTALRLQLQKQVEMAQLQYPAMLMRELTHSRQVIHHHGANPALGVWWNGRHSHLPAGSTFLALQEQWIEEGRVVATAWLEGRQVKDPGHAVELEP